MCLFIFFFLLVQIGFQNIRYRKIQVVHWNWYQTGVVVPFSLTVQRASVTMVTCRVLFSSPPGEIDRCLKKVAEGVEQFEDIWQKVRSDCLSV